MRGAAVASLVLAWGLGSGCAHAPPGPPGPIRGSGIQVQGNTYGNFSSVTASTGEPEEEWKIHELRGGGFLLLPNRFGMRGSWTDWSDVSIDASWLDVGGDVRVGVRRQETSVPWAISAGGRTGRLGLIDRQNRRLWELRMRGETYPVLSERWELVLSGALSSGRRWNYVVVEELDNFAEERLDLSWRDTRFEAALGIGFHAKPGRSRQAGLRLAVMPYFPLGAATAVEATGTAEVAGVPVSVVQDIGFVIVLDYWMFFAIEKPD